MADITLFPAHAGVILSACIASGVKLSFPRTRGGDPRSRQMFRASLGFSPHTRG